MQTLLSLLGFVFSLSVLLVPPFLAPDMMLLAKLFCFQVPYFPTGMHFLFLFFGVWEFIDKVF